MISVNGIRENLEKSFRAAVFNAVVAWGLENEIVCDHEVLVWGFKFRDHAIYQLAKEEKRDEQNKKM